MRPRRLRRKEKNSWSDFKADRSSCTSVGAVASFRHVSRYSHRVCGRLVELRRGARAVVQGRSCAGLERMVPSMLPKIVDREERPHVVEVVPVF